MMFSDEIQISELCTLSCLLSWLKSQLLLQYDWLGVTFKFQTPAGKQVETQIWTSYWRVMPCMWISFPFDVRRWRRWMPLSSPFGCGSMQAETGGRQFLSTALFECHGRYFQRPNGGPLSRLCFICGSGSAVYNCYFVAEFWQKNHANLKTRWTPESLGSQSRDGKRLASRDDLVRSCAQNRALEQCREWRTRGHQRIAAPQAQ